LKTSTFWSFIVDIIHYSNAFGSNISTAIDNVARGIEILNTLVMKVAKENKTGRLWPLTLCLLSRACCNGCEYSLRVVAMKSSRKSKAGEIGWPGKFFSSQDYTLPTVRLDAGGGHPAWRSRSGIASTSLRTHWRNFSSNNTGKGPKSMILIGLCMLA
jgi:hypothetical protein